jgi:hypothetical protein
MKRKQLFLALLTFVLLANGTASPVGSAEVYNQIYTLLTRWHLSALTNHLTSQTSNEQPAGTFEGQLFYIPASHLKGTQPLFRNTLQRGSDTDHMDSNIEGDKGYRSEGPLGHAFKKGPQEHEDRVGLAPIERWVNPVNFDHLTAFFNEDPAAAGFTPEGPQGFGYPRYGLDCERLQVLRGSEVAIAANTVAGGSIARLEWNDMQFVNAHDYGRQIQTAINFEPQGEIDNPTEAGSKYGCPGVMPLGRAQGSPLLSLKRSNRLKTLETVTAPLQWNPDLFGGDADHPVVWSGTISKKIELDYQGFPNRIKWTTRVGFPRDRDHLGIEMVTAYLRGMFNTFHIWTYNPETGRARFAQKTPSKNACTSQQRENIRGVIISTEDGAYALGAYRSGGKSNRFTLCNFIQNPNRTGTFDPSTSKLSVINGLRRKGVEEGVREWETYLVVGDRKTVRLEMEAMAAAGW